MIFNYGWFLDTIQIQPVDLSVICESEQPRAGTTTTKNHENFSLYNFTNTSREFLTLNFTNKPWEFLTLQFYQ